MKNDRRSFFKTAVTAGIAMGMTGKVFSFESQGEVAAGGKIGIIGLDTSHVVAFTKTINDGNAQGKPEYKGFKVVAAYPTKGSEDMPASVNRLEGFTNTVKEMGVEIVNSIDELLDKTDVILLESVDGRRHLDEARPVLKAGKRMFIDKPVAHNLSGAIKIFNESEKYKVPVFSCSTTRFSPAVIEIVKGKDKVGKVLGASTYCPAGMATGHLEMAFYGIHGIEALFTMMGSGCQEVRRITTSVSDTIIGTWNDGRTGIFNAVPKGGLGGFGGTVYGEKGVEEKVQILAGYNPMLEKIIEFFRTGVVPVQPDQTLEIFAFMEAADESNLAGGKAVTLESVFKKAKEASI